MSDYKDIIGTKVTVVSSNPDNSIKGQVWYNTTDNVLRYNRGLVGATWSSGGALNTAWRFLAGSGIQTAGLGFGGGPPVVDNSEEYNGSSWTEGNNLNTARATLAGCGTQTAALAFGGYSPAAPNFDNETEEYEGTSWSEQNNLNTIENNGIDPEKTIPLPKSIP